MQKFICKVCGYTYDPAVGEPDSEIDAGIPFGTLPEDWTCPQCHAPQTEFEPENEPMPGIVVPVGE